MSETGGVLRLRDFKGLNLVQAPDFMDPRQTPDAQNVWTDSGVIKKRPGLTPEYTTELASEDATEPGGTWQVHFTTVGTQMLVARGGNSVSHGTGGGGTILRGDYTDKATSWTVLTSASSSHWSDDHTHMPMANMQDMTVITPANSNQLFKFFLSGTYQLERLAAYPSADNDSGALAEYNNMLFRYPTNTKGAVLRYSGINNPETWNSAHSLTVGSDYGLGRFLRRCGDWMLAGKSSGLFTVRGYGPASNRTDPLMRGLGTKLNGWAAESELGVFFAGSDVTPPQVDNTKALWKGVYLCSTDGSITNISEDIAGGSLFGAWANAKSADSPTPATGLMHWARDTKTLYFIPMRACARQHPAAGTVANSEGLECWVWQNGNWNKWTFVHDTTNKRSFQLSWIGDGYDGTLLATGGCFDGYRYIYRFDDAVAMDNNGADGTPYTCSSATYATLAAYWTTPYLMFSGSDTNDYVHAIYLYGKASGTGAGVKVEYRLDDTSAWTQVNQSDATAYWPLLEGGKRVTIGEYCRRIQFRFTFTDASYSAEIQGIDVVFEPMGRQS